MKKTIASLLAASMLIAPSVATAGNDIPALELDGASPFSAKDNIILVEKDTTAATVRSAFRSNRDIVLTAPDESVLLLSDKVGSGVSVRHSGSDEKMTLIVPGDANGDAKINARDVIGSMRAMLGQTDGIYMQAADVDHDGTVNAKDVIKLMRYLVGYNGELNAADRVVADNDDEQITMYFDSMLHRIERGDTEVHGSADGLFYTAKNELEDAQLVITSEAAKKDLTLEVSAPTNENGKTLGYEVRYGHYYALNMFDADSLLRGDSAHPGEGYYTDPYPPLTGAFDIGKNESKSFMVQLDVPADAESGYYKSDVILKDSAGNEIKRATLRFYVWDFVLDEETACDTLFNQSPYGLAGYYSQMYDIKYADGNIWYPIYLRNFYDYMLKNRLAGYTIPCEIASAEADKYMSNPRVTSFVAFGGTDSVDWTSEEDRAKLKARYDKLQTNPEWAEKAYIYTVDEPWGLGGAEMVKNQWNQAKSVLGDTPFNVVIPFGNMYMDDLGVDMLDYLWDYSNGFCPSSGVLTPSAPSTERRENPELYPAWGDYTAERAIRKYGTFQPRYDKLRERGDNMWWYVCCSPEFPYANFFNFYQGAWTRAVLWEQYIVNSDGLLYWETALWQLGEHDSRKINLKRTGGGDGLLVYDGMLWGAPEPTPVPSGRLEAVRDGIEDFQYMRQLEREFGRDEVLKYVTRITTDVTHYETDYREMVKVRTEMGFALEDTSN